MAAFWIISDEKLQSKIFLSTRNSRYENLVKFILIREVHINRIIDKMIEIIAIYLSVIGGIIAIITFLPRLKYYSTLIGGWNFKIMHVTLTSGRVCEGDEITIKTMVKNTSRKTFGTYYEVIKIAYAYTHENPVHDTHRDLDIENKSKLRVVDVVKDTISEFNYNWKIPKELPIGVYDVSVEIWNPPHLYGEKHEKRFDRTKWTNNFEVFSKS